MLGKLHTHENKDGGGHMASAYNRVLVANKYGELETLLITDHELDRLRKRSSKNEADAVEPNWLDRLFLRLGSLI